MSVLLSTLRNTLIKKEKEKKKPLMGEKKVDALSLLCTT